MIKRLLGGQINSITVAALLIALSSFLSRILGVFRDHVLAGQFGAGQLLDVYYAAFRVPDLIFNLLVLGALSAGFVPILTCLIKDRRCKHRQVSRFNSNQEAWYLANNIVNLLGAALVLLSAAGVLFAPALMRVIVPGFGPEERELAVEITRIMFLSPVFLGISSVLGGILQSFKRFFVYSLAPIMYNVGIIIGALFFAPVWGIHGLAWGVVLGAFLHMIIQLPMVWRLGYAYRPVFDIKNKNIRQIGRMMIPRTLTLAITQLNLLVITIIASLLASGSLTVFNFANNLQSLPIGMFGISFAVAAFPTLSSAAANRERLVENFSSVFRQILFFIVPSTVLLLALRAQVVRVVFGAGQFDWQDTILTIDTLSFFVLSLFAQASIPLLIRVFYARHDSKTPFYIGLVSVVVNILLARYFAGYFGVVGLALAFSLAHILNFMLLWLSLKWRLGSLDEFRILVSAVKFSAAGMACGAAVQGVEHLILPYVDMTRFWGVLLQGSAAGISGIAVYIAFCSLFQSEELEAFWNSFKQKIPWRRVDSPDQGEARGI
jgi:putative peptidoglycan lipid II flippase